MIHLVNNPAMARQDVDRFRSIVAKGVTGDFSPAERREIESRVRRMAEAARIVRRNNGGIDPILGR